MSHVGSSEMRYIKRKVYWAHNRRVLPLTRYNAWWLVHNVVSHPILAVSPSIPAIWFHDWTSKKLNGREEMRPSPSPKIQNRRAWFSHNTLAHIAIGLFPCSATFRFHDRTAEAMNVPDWV